MQWGRPTPWNRITDTCKNITLPQLSCGRKIFRKGQFPLVSKIQQFLKRKLELFLKETHLGIPNEGLEPTLLNPEDTNCKEPAVPTQKSLQQPQEEY